MQFPVFCDETTITGDGTEEHPLEAIGGGGGSPAEPDNSVQWNNAGSFGGTADFQFFPEGDPAGEMVIFVSSDGNNCELFCGTDTGSSQTTGTFIAQCDQGNIFICLNDDINAPLGIILVNSHPSGSGIALVDTSGGGVQISGGDGSAVLGTILITSIGFGSTKGQINIGGSGAPGAVIQIGDASQLDEINLQGAAVTIAGNPVNNTLGFFATTPIAQISGATLSTAADIIAALQSYGLFGA